MAPGSFDPARLPVALVQMTSTSDRAGNLDRTEALVRRAAGEGARLVALPENFSELRSEGDPAPKGEPLDGPTVTRFGRVARDHGIWLLLGSLPEASERPGKVHNTSVLLGPDGTLVAAYRKIHLFDVSIPGAVQHRESETVAPGDEVVTARTPWGIVGLSVCYDLRFPELYRALARRGATILLVPSAFTHYTGPFHWELLLRARAVENQVFVLAPAQTGRHSPSRASHGHSLIVDPWGDRVAEAGGEETVLAAEIDLGRVEEVRRRLPAHAHARDWLLRGEPRGD